MSWFGDTKSGITMIGPKVTAEALRARLSRMQPVLHELPYYAVILISYALF